MLYAAKSLEAPVTLRPWWFGFVAALSCVGLVAAGSAPAAATVPGRNGLIAFSQGDMFPGGGALVPGGGPSMHSQIYTISPSGGAPKQLTHVPSNRAAAAPAWSPDGKRIVYESNQSGEFRIWVMNANGSGQTQVTHEQGVEDFLPSFSPSGKRIVYSRCGEFAGFFAFCDLDTISLAGGGRRTLLSAGHWTNLRAEFSPDGHQIVFQSDRGGYLSAVWMMRADGSHVRRLTSPIMEAFWPTFAPNGRRVVFTDNFDRPTSNTWTARSSGGGLRQLTHFHSGPGVGFSSYAPSGTRIVSVCPGKCLSTLNADGSHLKRVTTGIRFTFLPDWGAAP
jgi:Tol biopolymer transport system component